MSLTRKISQLKNMPELQPDKNWAAKTKYELLSEIASQSKLMRQAETPFSQKADLFFTSFLSRLSFSFTRVVAVFLVLSLGFGLRLGAQASVPGQPLWPVKRSMEKVELSLARSSSQEAEIYFKHVNERLSEIDKILQTENNSEQKSERKEKAIREAVRHLERDVTAVDSSLQIVKEQKSPVEAVELIKKIAQSSKQVSSSLDAKAKAIQAVNNPEIQLTLSGAREVSEGVKRSAVGLAIKIQEEALLAALVAGQSADNQPDTNEIARQIINETSTAEMIKKMGLGNSDLEKLNKLVREIVESEIADAGSKIDEMKQRAEVVSSEAASSTQPVVLEKEPIQLNNIGERIKDVQGIKESAEEVRILQEAKELMEEGFLRDAFEKIYQIKESYDKADAILEELRKAIQSHDTIDPNIIDDLSAEVGQVSASSVPAKLPE
ncbi:MAG: DUF5667 domain-containing protein [Patescibacteria group bacterium]|nr:DUF5667 domain-containing protein [Patescibacteria group bacterium]